MALTFPTPNANTDWKKFVEDHHINIDKTELAQAGYLTFVYMCLHNGKRADHDEIAYFCRYHGFTIHAGTDKLSVMRKNKGQFNAAYNDLQLKNGIPINDCVLGKECRFAGKHHRICTTKKGKPVDTFMTDSTHQEIFGTDPSLDQLPAYFDAVVEKQKKLEMEEKDAKDATVAPVSLKRSRDDENLSIFAPVIQAKRPRLDTTFDFTAQSVVPTNIATAGTTQARLTDIEIAALLSFINPITTSDDTVSTPTPYNFDALLGIDTTSDTTVSTPYNFDIDLDALLGITNTTSDNTVPTPYKFDIDALRGLTNTTSDNTVPTPSTFAFDWSTPVEISAPVIPDALAFFKL